MGPIPPARGIWRIKYAGKAVVFFSRLVVAFEIPTKCAKKKEKKKNLIPKILKGHLRPFGWLKFGLLVK